MPLGMRDLSSQPGIEPAPPAVEVWSLNHWTAREVPQKRDSETYVEVQNVNNSQDNLENEE